MISLKTYNSKFFRIVYLVSLIVSLIACKSEASQPGEELLEQLDTMVVAPKDVVPIQPKPLPNGLHNRLKLRADCSLFSEDLKNSTYFNRIATKIGPFTIFVPVESSGVNSQKKDSVNWVGNYIVENNYSSPVLHKTLTDFVPQLKLKTLAGPDLLVSRKGDTLFAKDNANNVFRLTLTDVLAQNGVIHIMVKEAGQ